MFLLPSFASAHLNHLQFASIEETENGIQIIYRVSQDMLQSSVARMIQLNVAPGQLRNDPVKAQLSYFLIGHISANLKTRTIQATLISWDRDAQNNDWIVTLNLALPNNSQSWTLFCDAFLSSNPKTGTLAQINWQGNKTLHHFRVSKEKIHLQATQSGAASSQQSEKDPTLIKRVSLFPGESFEFKGVASVLGAYLTLLLIICLAFWTQSINELFAMSIGLLAGLCGSLAATQWGWISVCTILKTAMYFSILVGVGLHWLDTRALRRFRIMSSPGIAWLALGLGLTHGPFLMVERISGWPLLSFQMGVILGVSAIAITAFLLSFDLRNRFQAYARIITQGATASILCFAIWHALG